MVKLGGILFFVSLIAGLYFLNLGFGFFDLSKIITDSINKVIMIVGGVLLILGGFFSMRQMAPRIAR